MTGIPPPVAGVSPGPASPPSFPPGLLPYGVFRPPGGRPRVGVALGREVVEAAPLLAAPDAALLAGVTLDPLLAAGPAAWARVRAALLAALADGVPGGLAHPIAEVQLGLAFTVADYVDFYSSEHHATNVGRIFRPDGPPLSPNWKHLPVGYHGRAGTVVVSGTPVARPHGLRAGPDHSPVSGPCARLDFEAEVGFVVGAGSPAGSPVRTADLDRHVFGLVLLNDWSARDIQSFETVPLGPLLGKSFATSVSAWVVPLAALEHAWVPPADQQPAPIAHLSPAGRGLDLSLEVAVNGSVVSRPCFADMYWTPAQQLAHLTSNGSPLRTGDLFGSGTVSGPGAERRGCLLELTWNGTEPLRLDGRELRWLEDGDTVTISATAPGPDGTRLWLGAVEATVTPAAADQPYAAQRGGSA
jgi:fumarylacetoacetase